MSAQAATFLSGLLLVSRRRSPSHSCQPSQPSQSEPLCLRTINQQHLLFPWLMKKVTKNEANHCSGPKMRGGQLSVVISLVYFALYWPLVGHSRRAGGTKRQCLAFSVLLPSSRSCCSSSSSLTKYTAPPL